MLLLIQNKVQSSFSIISDIDLNVDSADDSPPHGRQRISILLKKLDSGFERFTEPDGAHFFIAEILREAFEFALLLVLLVKLSNVGAGPHYLQVLGILIGLNSAVTPHLMFSKNRVLRTHGVIIFDVFMDTSIGALLPMLSIGIIIQVCTTVPHFPADRASHSLQKYHRD